MTLVEMPNVRHGRYHAIYMTATDISWQALIQVLRQPAAAGSHHSPRNYSEYDILCKYCIRIG